MEYNYEASKKLFQDGLQILVVSSCFQKEIWAICVDNLVLNPNVLVCAYLLSEHTSEWINMNDIKRYRIPDHEEGWKEYTWFRHKDQGVNKLFK